jgi:flagellar protein FliO/FliZ
MQALSLLSGNKALAYGAAAIALIVAALLVLLVFRLAFGRRLRMSNNRGRQLRLGIVDAFDLDRQRQLVIVRRDNTEHLIMIGGPNDLVIESQIVRAEARDGRQRDKDREKERREKDHAEPAQLAPAQPLKPAALEPQLPLPPFVPEAPAAEEPVSPRQMPPLAPATTPTPAPSQPAGRAPLSPVGPRRPPVRAEVKPTPVVPPPAATTPPAAPEPAPQPETPPPLKPPVGPAAPAQGLARWRPGQSQTIVQRSGGPTFTQPVRPSEPAAPAPAATEAKPANPPGPPATPRAPDNAASKADAPAGQQTGNEELMVSLEEEMAKLLGRAPDK